MRAILKCGQWGAFFLGWPFLMIGCLLMDLSDTCHDKALSVSNGDRQ
jgi:hypothetical protein